MPIPPLLTATVNLVEDLPTIAAVFVGTVTVYPDFPLDTIIWAIFAIVYVPGAVLAIPVAGTIKVTIEEWGVYRARLQTAPSTGTGG